MSAGPRWVSQAARGVRRSDFGRAAATMDQTQVVRRVGPAG
ncbi:hypothetical protein [Luteipulveratus halotolerans]|nr:hypothetical protein [Luteipulveratus halotolerans]